MDMRTRRRRFLAATGSGVVATLGGCQGVLGGEETDTPPTFRECEAASAGTRPGDGDWPRFRGDAANTGVVRGASGPALEEIDPEDDVTELFSLDDHGVYPPLVVDDTVFFNSTEGLYALDAVDGSIQWEAPRGQRRAHPTRTGDRFVYAVDAPRPTVAALDPTSGCQLWTVRAGDSEDSVSTLATTTEQVYYNAGRTIRAISTTDGSQRWEFEPSSMESPTGLAVADDLLVVGGTEETVALDAVEGTIRWTVPVGLYFDRPYRGPVVTDGTVYLYTPDSHEFVALDREDGSERWRIEDFGGGFPPAATDDRLYVGYRDQVKALAPDGTDVWTSPVSAALPPTLAGDGLYVASHDRIDRLDPETGDREGMVKLSTGDPRSEVVVADDTLLIVTQSGSENIAEHLLTISA